VGGGLRASGRTSYIAFVNPYKSWMVSLLPWSVDDADRRSGHSQCPDPTRMARDGQSARPTPAAAQLAASRGGPAAEQRPDASATVRAAQRATECERAGWVDGLCCCAGHLG
jgi:hypothetical protein